LLAEECISDLPENPMYGESLTMALMAALFASQAASIRSADSGLARWQLKRVLEFLETHLAEDIGLHELAKLVGLSHPNSLGLLRFRRDFHPINGAFRIE
jgi:AraC family transcriptional regulator